jgi:hypothetical protein
MKLVRLICLSVLLTLALAARAAPARAATLCVNPGGTAGCFAAIQGAVDAAASGDTILVATGTYAEHVVLPSGKTLTIRGAGATRTMVDGSGTGIVFDIPEGVGLIALSALTIQHGNTGISNRRSLTLANSRVVDNAGFIIGGGIFNVGRLDVSASTFARNVGFFGAGINNFGPLDIEGSTFTGNSATLGGAIGNTNSTLTAVTVTDSTISGNQASDRGGGIFSEGGGSLIVRHSTLARNHAGFSGGAILNFSNSLFVANSTIFGNAAEQGGGIDYFGFNQALVVNSTLAGNSAVTGANIVVEDVLFTVGSSVDLAIVLKNTIVANGQPGGSCSVLVFGAIVDGGHNFDTDGTCGFSTANGSLTGVDPKLGPLADNGGPTRTMALLPGSPAIDAGDNATCTAPQVGNVDQRHVIRITGADPVCDMGAFEFHP